MFMSIGCNSQISKNVARYDGTTSNKVSFGNTAEWMYQSDQASYDIIMQRERKTLTQTSSDERRIKEETQPPPPDYLQQ